jgi:hypothetical protein
MMSMSAAVLNALTAIRALTQDERNELFDEIETQYFTDDEMGLDPKYMAEIRRRSMEFDEGKVKGRSVVRSAAIAAQ